MSAPAAAALTASSALIAWLIAAWTMGRRGASLGAPPLASLALVALVALAARPPYDAARFVTLGGVAVAAICDARTGLIVRPLTSFLAITALMLACIEDHPSYAGGALALGGILLALHLVTGGRGIGLGDVRLGIALGAGLGIVSGLFALGCAFVLGGVYAGFLLVTGRAQRGDTLRFGPFIAAGLLVTFVPIGTFP